MRGKEGKGESGKREKGRYYSYSAQVPFIKKLQLKLTNFFERNHGHVIL